MPRSDKQRRQTKRNPLWLCRGIQIQTVWPVSHLRLIYFPNSQSSASSVAFPSTESPKAAVPQPRPTYLPFRRISLPTAPTLMHRQSVVSVASFDSLPEEQSSQTPVTPVLIRNANPRKSRGRTSSIEGQKRNRRRDNSSKPRDSAQEVKRRKIIQEFYETEKAYVDGLELIYSVSSCIQPLLSNICL